jgi:hypothetical protein
LIAMLHEGLSPSKMLSGKLRIGNSYRRCIKISSAIKSECIEHFNRLYSLSQTYNQKFPEQALLLQ